MLLIGLIACLSFSFTFKVSYGALSQDWMVTADFKDDHPYGLDIDSSGDIYVAGYMDNFSGLIEDMGNIGYDIFLLKYNSLGTQQWIRTYQVNDLGLCNNLVVDNENKVYLVGYISTSPDDNELFLMKYDSSGNLQWNRTGRKNYYGVSIKIDSYNNILVSGSNLNSRDIFLQKYDSSGNLLWNRTWETPELDEGVSMGLDSSNNIYIGGTTNVVGVFKDIILVKFNSLGEFQWNLTCQTPKSGSCNDIIIDSLDNIYVLGKIYHITSDLGIWLLKYDNSSNLLWNVTWGGKGTHSYGEGLALDASDNIYITGSTSVSGSTDILVLKYDSTGDLKWHYTRGIRDYGRGKAIKIDSSENIYICGETNGIGDNESSCDGDVFLLKLSEASPQAFISGYNLPIVTLSVFGIGIAFYIRKRKSFS